ncbi:MAG: dicarboxylate/amino acid:cation symporter [Alishewanella agri]|jgi:Na+/H+-dicarboxylate symporter|uniref:Na+/H+-dicarboxylate symporter n=2 Tax=Alishewanella TaxID=111142 RepID=I9P0K7_9ALTE|nr:MULTISPECIES: dicarboxylate/amino acid:cation symporter [Alishewanella]EIW88437.1 Na+/H+-dicarboxylate symporter [Alishewanella agri BL06]EJI87044.1 Na+/H+-dicarboxylate symporter [Alishewanella aestuarii B11]MDD4863901.1 dicarboxylate/amino acid:cation symporter [Alishewanella agri]OCW97051.1 sodium:glutamate symporter [Alishewanella sp. HH-ZS]
MLLILKLVAGIVLGMLLGLYAPHWLTQILITFKALFGQLLFFTIPLLILFFITSGIAALPRNSGKLLGRTLGLAYVSTIAAGVLAFLIAALVIPMLAPAAADLAGTEGVNLVPYIEMNIPPVFSVMTALALAFVFGLGIASTRAVALQQLSDQGRDIIQLLLSKVIIPLLPLYIAGVFAQMAAAGTVFVTLKTFGIVLILAILLHWAWIITLFVIAGIKAGKSPFTLIRNMLPAYFTALGTMSSAATIPVSLQATKNNGVKDEVANFSVPLCATIHLSGSTITIVSCAVAVIMMKSNLEIPSLLTMIPFILTLGVVMLAAPGVPGGAVMSAVGLLGSMLGFGEGAIALMIALYMAQDSFGTACNVTGDGAIAVLVDKS